MPLLRANDGAEAAAREEPSTDGTDGAAVFYRYRDADGHPVVVDSLARVPASAKGHVERVTLEAPPRAFAVPLPDALGRDLHLPSFCAGAAAMLAVGAVLWLALRRRSRLLHLALGCGLLALGAGAYFGWVRRLTGQGGSLVDTPAALIDDARSAVQKMNERQREQQRVLRELESGR